MTRQGTETQRIGLAVQDLVIKPANKIHTKTLLGTLAKTISVAMMIVLIGMISGLIIFLASKRVNWKIKVIVMGCVAGFLTVAFIL